ncbi:glutathione S-transferase family protein [Ectothiorhodospiraceae bacterium WFHF3C12]|nr:glutathione S-transferase family protein [Ectothiorhodospiraceae bacterium WFHF3C12]
MIKLYGFSVSNYYNVVKAALLEKGLEFEEVFTRGSSDDDYRSKSPMGKVPCMEVEQGAISESQVALDYLEDAHPQPALYPADPFQRAKVREIMRVIELYLELPARRLYAEAFFGGRVSDETKQEVKPLLAKGMGAFTRVARFDPYLAGAEFTYADLVGAIHLPLIRDAHRTIYGEDPWAEVPQIKPFVGKVRERASMQQVMADYKAGLEAFLKQMKSGG